MIKHSDKKDLEVANYRYGYVQEKLNNGKIEESCIPARTLRLWVQNYKKAELIYNCGYIGLIPLHRNKGNKNRKLPGEVIETMENCVVNSYEEPQEATKATAYRELANTCEEKGILLPSYKTFCKTINSRSAETQTRKRKGNRAAYKEEQFYWELEQTTPRHGDRPFEICHIDHTELDIELIDSKTGENLGRPYLTLMIDAFSRRVPGFYLTFDPPSYRSLMMVIRECVKRHNRLPNVIVVDGGREFESIYFDALLANYEVTKKVRPAAKSRFGSVIERLFGTNNKMFIHTLIGNTQIMKNVRQVTKSVNPKNNAIWDIKSLHECITDFLYNCYDERKHPALDQSPREAFQSGMKLSGMRPSRLIEYDILFTIMTLPSTRKGTAKVQCGSGVKINNIYYWTDEMKIPEIENTQVEVRYDPFNIGIAYAYIRKEWIKCISQYYPIFNGMSEKEFKVVVQEIRKRKSQFNKNATIDAKEIVEFLQKTKDVEIVLVQRKKDFETGQTGVHNGITCVNDAKKQQYETKSNIEFNLKDKNFNFYGEY